MKYLFVCLIVLLAPKTFAQLTNESEVGFASANGNTKTLSLNIKQKSDYKFERNVLSLKARYLNGKSGGEEIARFFSAEFRYERELTSQFSLFTAETFEKDKFSNIEKSWASDLGGKYKIIDSEKTKFFTELGYRYRHELRIDHTLSTSHYIRNYYEWNYKWEPTFSTKYSLELLPNIKDHNDWQYNTELALISSINSILSLSASSIIRYDHSPAPGVKYKTDMLVSSSLVAKF